MELETVESSMIHAAGYDAETRTLEVIFNSGNITTTRMCLQRSTRA